MRKLSKILALVLVLMLVLPTLALIPVSAATPEKLYLTPNANWKQSNARFAAYFFGNGEKWVSMTYNSSLGVYEVTVPSGYPNVIFCRMNPSATANNWNNKWNQTADLVVPTSGPNHYTVKEGTWDKGGGTWSTLGSTCTHANVGAAATCTTAQVCLDCGDPVVSALGHTYNSAHLCTRCNGQATFTVAGSGAHLGTEWDTGNVANDMTYADGTYTKVYTNVAAGTYQFKVARDHDWGTAYPGSDKSFTVATAGSTVTITLKGTTVNVTVEVPHTCAFVDGKCTCGEFDPTYTVVDSLEALNAALLNGGNILLNADIGLTDNKGLSVPAGVVVVLDLNGHVLGSNAAEAATSAVLVNRGSLTIKDSVGGGKITTAAVNPDLQSIPGYASNTITNYGVLVLESGTIENTTNAGAAYAVDNSSNGVNATFTMNGGKLEAARCALRMFCNSAAHENNVTVNGGEIVGGTRSIWIHLPGADSTKPANGNLTINGGTLNGGSGQSLYVYTYGNNHTGTFVTITGGTFLNDVLFGGGDYKETQETVSITGGTFNGWLGRYLANDGWEDLTGDEGYHLVDGVIGTHSFVAGEVVAPTYSAQGYTVYSCACGATENRDFTDKVVPAFPEVVVTPIENPELTFALNFGIKDVETFSEEYVNALLETYGDMYVDYCLTIEGLTADKVVFNANGGANGFLGGQYDDWSENWVYVPFENVEIANGGSLMIMEYAAELMGKGGLRQTLADIVAVVVNFDCGVFFTEEFLLANPNMKVTLDLIVFTEDAEGNKTLLNGAPIATNEFSVHKHEYTTVVTAPTCTEAGYTTFTCACGDTYTGNEVAALGHVDADPCDHECDVCGLCITDCVDGNNNHKCDICNDVMSTCADDDKNHFCDICGVQNSHCIDIPPYDHICGWCGEKMSEHEYDTVVTAPTCTAAGYTTYTCACGDTYTGNEVAALGHNFFAGKCTVCGVEDPNFNPYLLNFSQWPEFAKETYADGDVYKYNDIFTFIMGKNSRVDASSKTWDDFSGTLRFSLGGKTNSGVPTKNAIQITVDGAYTLKIWYVAGGDARYFALVDSTGAVLSETTKDTVKNSQYYSELIIPAAGTYYLTIPADNNYIFQIELVKHEHKYESAVTAPTCTAAGYTTYTCACGDTYTGDEVAALGHTAGAEAICTTAQTCTVCGAELVAALGHDIVVDAAVDATCTETGLTAGEHCSRCDHVVAQEEIPALGHTEEVVAGKDATCTEAGLTEGKKCSVCGETLVAQEEIPATGHTFVEGKCECGAEDPDYVPEQPSVDEPTDEPTGFAKIWAMILEFFSKIAEMFKGLFSKG